MAWSAAISWIVLRPLIASMATLALNSGLWVRRLLNSFGEGYAYGGSPFQGRCPASEVNDGGCPEKPDHLTGSCRAASGSVAPKGALGDFHRVQHRFAEGFAYAKNLLQREPKAQQDWKSLSLATKKLPALD